MRRLQQVAPVLLLMTVACSATSTQAVAPSQAIPTSSPSSEASGRAPIPEELLGEWESHKGTDPVLLTFQENGQYRVRRGYARGFGNMAAEGPRLDFFGGDPCPDRGSYEWTVEGDTLTFTQVGEDACPGRAAVFVGLVYTRRE
jgi:hypothetical protein